MKAFLALGLTESAEPGDPTCAWRLDGVRVDVMPANADILGFTNRWYESAARTAKAIEIDGVVIRVIDAPHFVGTKLEAFNDRGRRDCYASHDLEDIIAVIDGRPELIAEIAQSPRELQDYLRDEFGRLLANPAFLNALPGHVAEEGRESVVLKRWTTIATSATKAVH